MRKLTFEPTPNHCSCGAICAPTDTRCPKCIARLRWLRRKAWRTSNAHRQQAHRLLEGKR